MNVGIVGHEAAKFTPETEQAAKQIIANIIGNACLAEIDMMIEPFSSHHASVTVVSGECHLGGVDIWAKDEAMMKSLDHRWVGYLGYPPKDHTWSSGYKLRNMQIANASDIVHVIVVRELPPSFKGMRHSFCYHCGPGTDHVKSGGCWTAKQAVKMGKEAKWHVV